MSQLTLLGARLVDPGSGWFGEARDVLLRDGVIAAIGPPGEAPGRTLDARGRYLVPGLWESEAHLTRTPSGVPADLAPPPGAHDPRIVANLGAYLRAGVTTVVDLGGPLPLLAEVAEALRRGELAGPRLLMVGHQLSTDPDVPAFMRPFVRPVRDPADARRAVAQLAAHSIVGVKVNHHAGAPDRRVLLGEIVAEADRLGLPVLAHVDDAGSALEALAAGVANIEHMVLAEDPDQLQRIIDHCVRHRVYWPPTLVVFEAVARAADPGYLRDIDPHGTLDPDLVARLRGPESIWGGDRVLRSLPRLAAHLRAFPARFAFGLRHLAAIHAAGVPMTVSTDAGNAGVFHGLAVVREAELMVAAGLPTAAVLTALTSAAAAKFGLAGCIGSLAVGQRADLVVLAGNPLEAIGNLRSVAAVLVGGEQAFLAEGQRA